MIEPHKAIARLLFALTLTLYLFTAGGSLTTTDAVATFDVTRSIVEHRSVAMSGNLLGREEERGVDGRYYAPFGIGQSIYNIPFYLAARGLDAAGIRIGKPDSLAKAFVALGQTMLVAAIVRETFLLAAAVVGNVPAAALAALTLGMASVLWPYSRFGFNQPLACFTLLAAVRQLFLGVRTNASPRIVYAGLWVAASLMTRHEMALAAVPMCIWLWCDGRVSPGERAQRVISFAPGVILGVAIWGGYNFIRFGSVTTSGQDSVTGFGSPIVPGLLGLLLSPSASVFLYSPIALAGLVGLVHLARRDRRAAVFLASLVIVFVGFYATLGNWLAGRSYGSRYLVIVLPYVAVGWAAWLAALTPRARRRAVIIVGGLGLVLQMPGVLIDYAKVSQAAGVAQRPFTTEERQWRWEASPLVMNTRALVRALPENAGYVVGRRTIPAVTGAANEGDHSFSQQFNFSLDLWWLYLHYLEVLPAAALPVVIIAFAAVFGFLARRLRRELDARYTDNSAWT